MRNVVDKLPNKPEKCLYSYKTIFGTVKCKLSKKDCMLKIDDNTGKIDCDKLMPLDDTLKETLRAYTKILDKKI